MRDLMIQHLEEKCQAILDNFETLSEEEQAALIANISEMDGTDHSDMNVHGTNVSDEKGFSTGVPRIDHEDKLAKDYKKMMGKDYDAENTHNKVNMAAMHYMSSKYKGKYQGYVDKMAGDPTYRDVTLKKLKGEMGY